MSSNIIITCECVLELLEIRAVRSRELLYESRKQEEIRMGNKDTMLIVIAILATAFILQDSGQQTVVNGGGGGTTDLSQVVSPVASFTGQRMFKTGTALTGEWVRVIRVGSSKDLGLISMNSGTLAVTPKSNYKLYFGENSSTYYTHPMDYVGPSQDGTDDVVGEECYIDTTPTTTTFDEYGQVQDGAGGNDQTLAASGTYEVAFRVKVSAEQCWGNPNSPVPNAACILYNSSAYTSITSDKQTANTPYSISSAYGTTGYNIVCFQQKLLQDNEFEDTKLTVKTSSTWADTHGNVNLTLYLDDAAFDLDQDTLAEIWGYEDESNNNLGCTSVPTVDYIHIT